MGAAPIATLITPECGGIRRFGVSYQTLNYDAATVWWSLPETLAQAASGGVLVVTDVVIQHIGTIGVVMSYVYMRQSGSLIYYMPDYATARSPDTHHYGQLELPFNPSVMTMTDKTYWLVINPVGYANTDDFSVVSVRGRIELPSTTTPVSLDGYKWPLTRRT